MKKTTLTLSTAFASYLVNGDASGLPPEHVCAVNAYLAGRGLSAASCASVDTETIRFALPVWDFPETLKGEVAEFVFLTPDTSGEVKPAQLAAKAQRSRRKQRETTRRITERALAGFREDWQAAKATEQAGGLTEEGEAENKTYREQASQGIALCLSVLRELD